MHIEWLPYVDWTRHRGLQPLMRTYRGDVLTFLEERNRSENRWKRRASVVAFVRKIGASGEFVDEALEQCENLI